MYGLEIAQFLARPASCARWDTIQQLHRCAVRCCAMLASAAAIVAVAAASECAHTKSQGERGREGERERPQQQPLGGSRCNA
jgi:hypothetical protein